MRRFRTLGFIILLSMPVLPALAQQPAPPMAMPGMAPHAAPASRSPAAAQMMAGMDKMSRDLAAAPMTGDADQDFVAMMIPHHQGAVDMAEVELQYGKNPELRRLARSIVAAQQKEIAQMRRWQAAHR